MRPPQPPLLPPQLRKRKGEFLMVKFHFCLSITCFFHVVFQNSTMTGMAEVIPRGRQVLGADDQ